MYAQHLPPCLWVKTVVYFQGKHRGTPPQEGGKRMKFYCYLLALLSLTACGSAKSGNTSGSAVTTVTRSATAPNYGSNWDESGTVEYTLPTYGTKEDYVFALDQIFWEMDRLNHEISTAMLQEDWDEGALTGFLRSMEETLRQVEHLEPPKTLQQIQGDFALAAADMAELYGTMAYLLGEELAFAKLNALIAETESKTQQFNTVATVLLQALM